MNYERFFEFIDNIIKGGTFNGVSLPERRDDFWEALLEYISNEADHLEHSIIRENDLSSESLAQYINDRADLDSFRWGDAYASNEEVLTAIFSYIDAYINQLPEGESHWNESLSALVDFYIQHFDNPLETELPEVNEDGTAKDTHGNIPNGGAASRIDDIVNGDAGNYFGTDEDCCNEDGTLNYDKTYVRPWFNIEGDNYITVRKEDRMKDILGSAQNLQFTRFPEKESDYLNTKTEGLDVLQRYLRLIMPKYERSVEIEDLNRNFWVIGQLLSALCAYLFDDDSPIPKMFQGILDEVTQLWENVAYLWAASALNTHKKYKDIQVIFVPVWNDKTMPFVKFDNFALVKEETLEYLKGEYGESNLVIVPEVRSNNYMRNYYYHVQYPCIVVYNRNNDTTYQFTFSSPCPSFDLSGDEEGLDCSGLNCFIDYGARYYININEEYGEVVIGSPVYAIRSIFDCTAEVTDSLDIEISDISFEFIDVAADLYGRNGTFLRVTTDDCTTADPKALDYYTQYFDVSISSNRSTSITKGYYLGELCSWMGSEIHATRLSTRSDYLLKEERIAEYSTPLQG